MKQEEINKNVEDFIENFGVSEIIKHIDLSDILDNFTNEEIMDELDEDDMASYLDRHCYDFSEYVDDDIEDDDDDEIIHSPVYCLHLLRQSLSSRPVLTKDDLRNVINEYIDSLPNICF